MKCCHYRHRCRSWHPQSSSSSSSSSREGLQAWMRHRWVCRKLCFCPLQRDPRMHALCVGMHAHAQSTNVTDMGARIHTCLHMCLQACTLYWCLVEGACLHRLPTPTGSIWFRLSCPTRRQCEICACACACCLCMGPSHSLLHRAALALCVSSTTPHGTHAQPRSACHPPCTADVPTHAAFNSSHLFLLSVSSSGAHLSRDG